MSLVFDINNQLGSLKDLQTGNNLTNNNSCLIKKTEKGRGINLTSSSSQYLSESSNTRQYSVYSIEVWVNFSDVSSRKCVFSLGTTGDSDIIGIGVQSGVGSATNLLYGNFTGSWRTADSGIIPIVGKWYHCIAINDGSQMTFYVDGQLKATTAGSGAMSLQESIWLGARHDSSNYNYFDGNISRSRMWNHVLSTEEIQNLYNEFLNSRNIEVAVRKFRQDGYKINVDDDSSLVAYYDFASKSRALDLTNNHNDGTLTGGNILFSDKGAKGDGSGYFATGDINLGTSSTIIMNIKFPSAANKVLWRDSSTEYWHWVSTTSFRVRQGDFDETWTTASDGLPNLTNQEAIITTVKANDSVTLYINGVSYGTMTNGTGTATTFDNIFSNAGAWDGIIKSVELYNRVLSETEVKNRWNKIARQKELYIEGTNWNAIGNTITSGKVGDFDIQSGSFKVEEDSNGKYIESVADGVISTQSKSAYGTWEFEVYKGADANVSRIQFIDDNKTGGDAGGYDFRLENNETIKLAKTGVAVLFETAASYIQNNTWYKVRITRTLDGEFTVYIKSDEDNNFEDWTLVDPTGGSGTNPVTDTAYTTSNYFVPDLDTGDRIKNIKISKGVEQWIR